MSTLAERLKQARKEAGLSQAGLAKLVGTGQSTIGSIENGRNQSSGMLVDIARALDVNPDWLAHGRGQMRGGDSHQPSKVTQIRQKKSDEITIRQFETGGAMGAGLELRDQPGIIQSWSVNKEWLQKNVRSFSAANNLCIVTGFGDSMRPMFNPGDPLIVDTGVTTVDFDAIYFFRVGNEGFIKRLQRIPTPDGTIIRAKSENKKYDAWDISTGMDLEVFGRVLKVWCSEDF